ncbi:hypothetical protein [Lysinibacillus sp. NPDC092081]|uniref:hypothetical protein n=1 Tax=Lysinibacillus sp. NPDC092081 TaxID=3364131 RepID=UPI00382E67A6
MILLLRFYGVDTENKNTSNRLDDRLTIGSNSDGEKSPQEMARILSTMTINGPFFAAGLKK